jgi:hypothetical protein
MILNYSPGDWKVRGDAVTQTGASVYARCTSTRNVWRLTKLDIENIPACRFSLSEAIFDRFTNNPKRISIDIHKLRRKING